MKYRMICFLCVASISGFAQQLSDENGKLLMKAYTNDKEEFNASVEAGRCSCIDYTYEAAYSYNIGEDIKEKVTEEEGRICYTKYSRQVVSDDYEVFVDSLDIFQIDKKNKSILRAKSNANYLRFDSTMLKRNILSDSTLKFYRITRGEKNDVTHFRMEALDKSVCLFESADFYYNSEQKLMTQIHVLYNKETAGMIKEFTFKVLQRGRQSLGKCNLVARNHVFTSQGKLAGPYVNFKFRDISKKSQ